MDNYKVMSIKFQNNCLSEHTNFVAFISLDKTMEHVAFGQLSEHLMDNNIIDRRQSAYRRHHSVETVLLSMTDHIFSIWPCTLECTLSRSQKGHQLFPIQDSTQNVFVHNHLNYL